MGAEQGTVASSKPRPGRQPQMPPPPLGIPTQQAPIGQDELGRTKTEGVTPKSSMIGNTVCAPMPLPPPPVLQNPFEAPIPFAGQRDARLLAQERLAQRPPLERVPSGSTEPVEEPTRRRWGENHPQRPQYREVPWQSSKQVAWVDEAEYWGHWEPPRAQGAAQGAALGAALGAERAPSGPSPSPQRGQSVQESRGQAAQEDRHWQQQPRSGYDPAKNRAAVPQGIKAYEKILPSMEENLWRLALDMGNFEWDERSKTNVMRIGYEKSFSNPSYWVYWTCEWIEEKKWYKRIGPLTEVSRIRHSGGTISVSPQEFALLPRCLRFSVRVDPDVLRCHTEHLTLRDPNVLVEHMANLKKHIKYLDDYLGNLVMCMDENAQPPPPPVLEPIREGATSSGHQQHPGYQ